MLVFRGFSRPAPAPTVLTIGNFDGVHLGHHALLEKLGTKARETGLMPAVLTFEPHPREFFSPETAPTRLSSLREKLELIRNENIALTFICPFTTALAQMSAEAFIEDLLVSRLRVRHLIVGDDFRYGAGRRGDFALLQDVGQRHGFTVETFPGVMVEGQRVSSSAVRAALAAGNIEDARQLLGRPYIIDGRVVRGQQLGRHLGVPTANIRIKHRRPPLTGVYAVEVSGLADGPHRGVANIGYRPSVDQNSSGGPRAVLEVHFFDFARDIYGAHLSVRFLHKIRDEQKFSGLDALKAQIFHDIESARQYFTH